MIGEIQFSSFNQVDLGKPRELASVKRYSRCERLTSLACTGLVTTVSAFIFNNDYRNLVFDCIREFLYSKRPSFTNFRAVLFPPMGGIFFSAVSRFINKQIPSENNLMKRVYRIALTVLNYLVIATMYYLPGSFNQKVGGSILLTLGSELIPSAGHCMIEYVSKKTKELAKSIFFQVVRDSSLISMGSWAVYSSGICLARQLPRHLLKYIRDFSVWNVDLRDKAVTLLGIKPASDPGDAPFMSVVIIGPLLEEVVLRLLIQEMFLRRIPKMIVHQVTPSCSSLVDSRPAKVARVVSVSALFALMHTTNVAESPFGVMPQFISGLIAGIKVESSHNIITSSFDHMTFNGLMYVLARVVEKI